MTSQLKAFGCHNIATINIPIVTVIFQHNIGRVKFWSFGYFLTNLFVVKVLSSGHDA